MTSGLLLWISYDPSLVLSQIGLAVRLVERGGLCADWGTDLALLLNRF